MRWQWIQNLCRYFRASILIRPPYTLPFPSPLSAEAKQLVRDFLRLAFNMKQFEVVEDDFLFSLLKILINT
jgi:hypothetical protein